VTSSKTFRKPHSVYLYQEEWFLLTKLQAFFREGISQNETVIFIATEAHRNTLKASLVPELGQYPFLIEADAEELLATFYRGGQLQTDRFFPATKAILAQAQALERPIRLFGEMATLLWKQGFRESALELELHWIELWQHYEFSMLCGYPLVMEQLEDINGILRLHTQLELSSTKIALRPECLRQFPPLSQQSLLVKEV